MSVNTDRSSIEIVPVKEDLRPAFILDDVREANLFRIKASSVSGVPMFALNRVKDFSVSVSKCLF